MKKRNLLMLVSVVALGSYALAGCKKGSSDSSALSTAPEFKEESYTDFKKGKSSLWKISDGWSNGGSFDVTWKSKNLTHDATGMSMSITKESDTYYAAEEKSTDMYKYGFFGVTMQAIKAAGTVSTFFTYTGDSDNGNPHDEIDVEILGKDTTKVQFNYFKAGKGGHEYMYDLGFDASEGMHQYGFYWNSDQIVWYVDKKPVYKVTDSIPDTEQRIFQNVWKGATKSNAWMGTLDDSVLPLTAKYDNCTYADVDGKAASVATDDQYENSNNNTDLTTFTAITQEWPSTTEYTTTNAADNKSADVSYTAVPKKSYKNIMGALPESASLKNIYAIKIKNNGTEEVTVRINIENAAVNKCLNTRAYDDKGTEINTDLQWGGSFFYIAAGDETTCFVVYSEDARHVQLMIDSTRKDKDTFAGNIHLSDYNLGGEQTPAAVDFTSVSEFELTWTASDIYSVENSSDNKYAHITYSAATKNYKNVEATLPDTALTKNVYSTTIENKGTADVSARINVVDSDTKNLNVSATDGEGNSVYTDTTYGGSFFTVPASSTLVCNITYSGQAKKVQLMLDSSRSDDDTHSGDLYVYDYKLRGEQQNAGGDDGDSTTRDLALTFKKNHSTDPFTLTANEDGSTTVAYTDVARNGYKNITASFDGVNLTNAIAIQYTFTNLGTEQIIGRMDINQATKPEGSKTTVLNTSATATGDLVVTKTDTTYGGSFFTLEGGKTGTMTINYTGTTTICTFFPDSSVYGDETTHTNSIKISAIKAVLQAA